MTAPIAIALIIFLDLALIAGVAYVMSRARLLKPHAPTAGQAPALRPAVSEPVARRRRVPAPSRSLAAAR